MHKIMLGRWNLDPIKKLNNWFKTLFKSESRLTIVDKILPNQIYFIQPIKWKI